MLDLLNDVDELDWLKRFAAYELNDCQRTALVFLREAVAIDAVDYRELTGCNTKLVAKELAGIKDHDEIYGLSLDWVYEQICDKWLVFCKAIKVMVRQCGRIGMVCLG